MAQFELVMPKMGESVAEATIIKWTKNEGDKIKIDETVLEIATDKVDSEIPSPFEGTLVKKMFKEGDVVQVGTVIAVISSDANASVSETPKTSAPENKVASSVAENKTVSAPAKTTADFSKSSKFYSPLVKNIAKEEGISVEELDAIHGSGQGGRVTKSDILAYLPNRNKQAATVKQNGSATAESKSQSSGEAMTINRPAVAVGSGDEIIEMDRMRKLIADHMVMSKHVSPHVTSFVEADVTNLVLWRDKMKKEFEKKEGEKLTFTPLFIEAVVKAIKDYPMINVSVDQSGTKIISKRNKDHKA
jgi:2-oxoglutarate dehydrogenase E2 component (dihydrolipoamide succinyltransferase)